MVDIARWVVIGFGGFLIGVGLLMLIAPDRTRGYIRMAGSTKVINYGEITLRMIPAAALVLAADTSRAPDVFRIFGWFMIATSLVLYFVPRRVHHGYAVWWADRLSPTHIRILSPVSLVVGAAAILMLY